jgi:hypothetical protein
MGRKALFTLFALPFLMFLTSAWYPDYANWTYQRSILIGSNDPTDLYNVTIHLSSTPPDTLASDARDLRFTQVLTNGSEVPLNFFVRFKNDTYMEVYLQLRELPAYSTVQVYVYWGNANATSVSSLDAFEAAVHNCSYHHLTFDGTATCEYDPSLETNVLNITSSGDYAGWNTTFTVTPGYYIQEIYNVDVGTLHVGPGFGSYSEYNDFITSFTNSTDTLHRAWIYYAYTKQGWSTTEKSYYQLMHNGQETTGELDSNAVSEFLPWFKTTLYDDEIAVEWMNDQGDYYYYDYSNGNTSTDYTTIQFLGSQPVTVSEAYIYRSPVNPINFDVGSDTINTKLTTDMHLRYTNTIYKWEFQYTDLHGTPIRDANVTVEVTFEGNTTTYNATWSEPDQSYILYYSTDQIGTYLVVVRANRDGYAEGYWTGTFEVVNPANVQIVVRDNNHYSFVTCLDEDTALYVLNGEICTQEGTACSDYNITKQVRCDFGCEDGVGCASMAGLPGMTQRADTTTWAWIVFLLGIASLYVAYYMPRLWPVGALVAAGAGVLMSALMPSPWMYVGIVVVILAAYRFLLG